MAILGTSDTILLPDGVNPNTHPDYANIRNGLQKQLLSVNENNSHLWIFNTSNNTWEKIEFLTENIGSGVKIFDDTQDNSYRNIRTLIPNDKSIKIFERGDTLDFRFSGHSFETFNKSGMFTFKTCLVRNHEFDNKIIGTRVKVLSVNGNKITTDLPLTNNFDFNPTKEGYNWAIRLDKDPSLQNGEYNYKIDKYNNGIFYVTKTHGVDIQVGDYISIFNIFMNYTYLLSNLSLNSFEFFVSGNTLFGNTIHSIEPLSVFYHNNKFIMLFVMRRVESPITWYLSYTTSRDLVNWTVPSNNEIIYQDTNNTTFVGFFYNNFNFDGINTNYHIIGFLCNTAPPNNGRILILDYNLNIKENINSLGCWFTKYHYFKYRGKLFRVYNGTNKDRKLEYLFTNDPFDSAITTNPSNNAIVYIPNEYPTIYKDNNIFSFSLLQTKNSNLTESFKVSFYTFLRYNNKFSKVFSSNIVDLLITTLSPYFFTDNIRWVNDFRMLTFGKIFFKFKNNLYVFFTGTGNSGNYFNKKSIGIFKIKNWTNTTIKKETTSYIKFEPTEDIITYNQGNQSIVELWANNTTINLLPSKKWINEDFIVINTPGWTITFSAASGETIEENNSYSSVDTKIVLRAVNGKIIRYNK